MYVVFFIHPVNRLFKKAVKQQKRLFHKVKYMVDHTITQNVTAIHVFTHNSDT